MTSRLVIAVGLMFMILSSTYSDSIIQSKHNLSVTGPGTVKAATEGEVCIFCHTPHNSSAEAPLWNRYSSGAVYAPYSSSTSLAGPGQPTGDSKLCLSCHDGTIALGMVLTRTEEIAVTPGRMMPGGRSNLTSSLDDDHPVSFTFDHALYISQGELVDPATLNGPVRLDASSQMQCTSCHDPHDDQYGNFLVTPNTGAALCTTCHDPDGWDLSIHRTSNAAWNGSDADPWPDSDEVTVAANGCVSCHSSHQAGTPERLLTYGPVENGCFACHNGNVANLDLEAEFGKASTHPVALTEVHDPAEDLVNPPRHVECADCHNPHKAVTGGGSAPSASGALKGVRGVSSAGLPVADVSSEYELCFRCHADSTDRGDPVVDRQFQETNTRTEFALTNPSHHAVLGPGANPDVPSLIGPYTTSSVISCTDCHNNNTGPNTGGSNANGPHGSIYEPILERRTVFTDGSTVNSTNQALCFKCHSRANIFNDVSFDEHKKHLEDRAACTTCHDPHGVETTEHLINFNTQYVTPSSSGRLEYIDNGTRSGSCFLSCHGENHNPLSY